MGPLDGIRIIDMTTVLMGPYATQTLGDFGADVIKIESPEGDVVRQIGPMRNEGMGPMYLNVNRSKRVVTLDLKHPDGRAALLELVRDADVLVYNVRSAAMARLGLAWEDVCAINPRLIYAGMFGYSQSGPYARRPAYDDLIQGGALLPYLFHRVNGKPSYVPAAIADRVVGLATVNAILAALLERQKSGLGQRVDVPMFETMVHMVMSDHLGGLTYDPPLDKGGYARHLSPDRRPYQTRDGFICALVYTDAHWKRFFVAIGQPDMAAADPMFADFPARMAHIDEVYGKLSEIMLTRTTQEWMTLLDGADIPVMPMHDFESLLEDPHLTETGFFPMVDHPSEGRLRQMAVPTRFYRTPAEPTRLAPQRGEHSVEVLREAGYGEEDIEKLLALGVLQGTPAPVV